MADNVDVTPGTGATIATDDVSGVQFQKIKIDGGADGATAPITGDTANGLDVDVTRLPSLVAGTAAIGKLVANDGVDIGDVTVNNATDINISLDGEAVVLGAGTAGIGKLTANSGVDIGDVDVASIAAGDNNIGNVDIASAIPAGTNLIGKVGIDQATANANEVVIKSGTVTAVTAITNALPAGTNAIGKLAANSGVDIGDVDVTSIAAGTNLIGKVGIDQVSANANEVVVKSGTVTAVTSLTNALPAGDNNIGNVDIVTIPTVELKASSAAIGKLVANDGVDIGDVTVNNSTDIKVTLDSEAVVLGAGSAAIGKLAANSGVDIGDVDVTSIAAGTNNIGMVDTPTATPTAYALTLTDANTEYNQALSAHCRGFEFQCRTETTIRFAFATGKVATPTDPYMTLKAGDYFSSPKLHMADARTLYFASATAGAVVEILEWV